MFILIFVSCKAIVNNPNDEYYVLLEARRHTIFIALNDTCSGHDIDFGGYLLDEENNTLKVYNSYRKFDNDDPFLLICAIDRSLEGELFGGTAGGCFPVYGVPDTLGIMSFPLPSNKDSLSITEINDKGGIELIFLSNKIVLQSQKEWVYKKEQDVITDFGFFNVNDSIYFINRGLLDKRKIEIY